MMTLLAARSARARHAHAAARWRLSCARLCSARTPQPPPSPLRTPDQPTPAASSYTDISTGTWAERLLPAAAGPYLRLARWDRPTGTYLLLWPCVWGTALAAPAGGLPDARLIALFAVGALAMRGAGCTINDMWDRDIDRQVERTRGRPLASGEVSMAQASAFLAAQLGVGLCVLTQLSAPTVGLALASVPLVVAYPLAKRFTGWPQLVLGLTINWGALVGWTAATGSLVPGPQLLLYAGALCWTLHYDTVYAYQDLTDDERIGVRSSARTLGREGAARLALGLWAAGAAVGVAGAGAVAGLGASAPFLGGTALAGAALGAQAATVRLDERADCLRAFRRSAAFGLAISAAIILGRLLQPAGEQVRDEQAEGARRDARGTA